MGIIVTTLMFIAFGFVFYVLTNDEIEINPSLVRLFKRDARGVVEAYHAAWVDKDTKHIIEHFGKIGTYGETVKHPRKMSMTDADQIELLLRKSRHNYFKEFKLHEYDRLTVQFKFNRNNEVDKKRAVVTRSRMRHAIDDVLSWTGLGKATKEKYQKDTMKILFDVTDFDMASYAIDNILKGIATPQYEIIKNRKRQPIAKSSV